MFGLGNINAASHLIGISSICEVEFDLVCDPPKNGTLERERTVPLVDSEFLISELSAERRVMYSKRDWLGSAPALFMWRLPVGNRKQQA